MANILNRQHYHKGDRIFRTGDCATSAFLIQAGSVDIVVGQGSNETVVGTLGPGEIFGEMALLDDAPRSAAAMARESTTCVLITRTDFQKRVDKSDPFIRALLKLLTKRLRTTTNAQNKTAE
ncbi:MAG: cyclic nucleotide-binding domain-containing protein [Proteobacteria bacterium]|nr:cyclic nucleotide-binding domain-containing protein [Pseudomonadota bacterium]